MCCLLNYQVGLQAGLSEVHGRGRTVGGACMGGRKGAACGCVGSCTWPRRQLHEMPRAHARRRAQLLACVHGPARMRVRWRSCSCQNSRQRLGCRRAGEQLWDGGGRAVKARLGRGRLPVQQHMCVQHGASGTPPPPQPPPRLARSRRAVCTADSIQRRCAPLADRRAAYLHRTFYASGGGRVLSGSGGSGVRRGAPPLVEAGKLARLALSEGLHTSVWAMSMVRCARVRAGACSNWLWPKQSVAHQGGLPCLASGDISPLQSCIAVGTARCSARAQANTRKHAFSRAMLVGGATAARCDTASDLASRWRRPATCW